MGNEARDLKQENSEQKTEQVNSSASAGFRLDALISRAKNMIFNPQATWEEIRGETLSTTQLYSQYLVPLVVAGAICSLLGLTIFGISVPVIGSLSIPFGTALANTVAHAVVMLAMIYVGGIVIQALAPTFSGEISKDNAIKLMAFAAFPALVGQLFMIIPVLGIVASLLGLYGLYVYYLGIPVMSSVPNDRRLGFFFVSLLGLIICGVVISVVIGLFTPSMTPAIDASEFIPKGFDADSIQNMADKLKEMAPK